MSILSGMDIERIGRLICAKVICKGFIGTTITLTGASIEFTFGAPIVVTITASSKFLRKANNNQNVYYEEVLVPIAPVTAQVVYGDFSTSIDLNITNAGVYHAGYTIDTVIYEKYTPGSDTFTLPSDVTSIWFLATAGGGGGAAGAAAASSTGAGGAGGGGGGGGQQHTKSAYTVTPGAQLSITVGAGGAGGIGVGASGELGGVTLVSGFGYSFSLVGGYRGILAAGSGGQNPGGAGGAGSSGGSKAPDGSNGYTFQNGILGGAGGIGGSGSGGGATATGGGGGGGGGNSVNTYGSTPDAPGGKGGDGAGYTYGAKRATAGQDAIRGAGGGGGGGGGNTILAGAPGGKGGDGFVVIYSRVSV